MGHGANTPDTGTPPRTPLTPGNAQQVATTLQALSTPSRLLILARLREGPCAATELATAVGMEQSACSHQLRLLRNLGLVTGTRQGRSVVYSLHDNHVAALLDQAVYHVEHLRLGVTDPPAEASAETPAGAARREAVAPVAPATPVAAID
ncbi:metalloregulator ArsR/SmtB family transcription factor [Streptomyces sp. DW26H14]|uniref:metalloregulator ArsR/SmtB family transcription factor n=1 Tax=Streptomyces sp. DW26H14 TaxID=3435395 RepID=UPI00403E2249